MGSHHQPKFLSFLIFCFTTLLLHSSATAKTHVITQRLLSLSETYLLTSPDSSFTCGFYGVGTNGYWLSIWFTHSRDRTVVWMANRDRPVNGLGSKATLAPDGSIILTDVDGTQVWSPTLSSSSANLAERVELLNSGNLVLRGPLGEILWQSFDFPTDTLPNQLFANDMKLVSKLERGDFGSGYFSLYFDSDNVLRLAVYDGPDISSLYWPTPGFTAYQNGRTGYNNSRIAIFDDLGNFVSSDRSQFSASDMGLGPKRRLSIDYDGNLRLYSLNLQGVWLVTWKAIIQKCLRHGMCGRNGICIYTPEPKCSCPPGYEVLNKNNWNKGCKPKFHLTFSEPVNFLKISNVDFYGIDLIYSDSSTFEDCKKICADDCRCEAFLYKLAIYQRAGEARTLCYTKGSLFSGHKSSNFHGCIYFKLLLSMNTTLPAKLSVTDTCTNNETKVVTLGTKRVRWVYMYSFAYAVIAVEFIFIVSGWWFLIRRYVVVAPALQDDLLQVISE